MKIHNINQQDFLPAGFLFEVILLDNKFDDYFSQQFMINIMSLYKCKMIVNKLT